MAASSFKPRYIIDCDKADEAVSFYKQVFGATEAERVENKRVELSVAGQVIQIDFEPANTSFYKKLQKNGNVHRKKEDRKTNFSSNPVPINGFEVTLAMEPEKARAIIEQARELGKIEVVKCEECYWDEGPEYADGQYIGYFTDVFGFKWSFVVG